MKKLFLLTISLLLILGINVFAGNINDPVNKAVQRAFSTDFSDAVNAYWTRANEAFKVSFTKNNTSYAAYYTEQGELLVTARIIFHEQLPLPVAKALSKKYTRNDIIGIQEYNNGIDPSYYFIQTSTEKRRDILKFYSNGIFEVLKQKNGK